MSLILDLDTVLKTRQITPAVVAFIKGHAQHLQAQNFMPHHLQAFGLDYAFLSENCIHFLFYRFCTDLTNYQITGFKLSAQGGGGDYLIGEHTFEAPFFINPYLSKTGYLVKDTDENRSLAKQIGLFDTTKQNLVLRYECLHLVNNGDVLQTDIALQDLDDVCWC